MYSAIYNPFTRAGGESSLPAFSLPARLYKGAKSGVSLYNPDKYAHSSEVEFFWNMRISSAELSLIQYPPEEYASLRERMEEAVKQDMENYYAATKSRESLKNKKKTAKYLEN